MDTNFEQKPTNSLKTSLASGANSLKLVAILGFVTQGLGMVQLIISRESANIIGVLVSIFLASLLWKQAAFLQQFQRTNNSMDLEDALKQEAIYWKSTSILMVLSFIGSIILILFPF